MKIRHYRPSDVSALADIYRDAALVTGRSAYSPEQVAAWASYADDGEAFTQRLRRGVTLVALIDDELAGFGQLDPVDHVSLLFTSPRHGRKGVATGIFAQLERHARKAGQVTLRTEASRVAMPLFRKLGFTIAETEMAEFRGMRLERFGMTKKLVDDTL